MPSAELEDIDRIYNLYSSPPSILKGWIIDRESLLVQFSLRNPQLKSKNSYIQSISQTTISHPMEQTNVLIYSLSPSRSKSVKLCVSMKDGKPTRYVEVSLIMTFEIILNR